MAMCTECGTPLPGRATSCPACGARRRGAGWERDAGAVSVGAYPALEPDLTFAEVRLVTTAITSEGRAGQDSPDLRARPTVPSGVVRNDLALCALVLAIAGLVLGSAAIMMMLGSLVGIPF